MTLTASAQDRDLVINNGRVTDPETMRDEIANVGVKDGVCGWQDTGSTLEQINQLNKLLDEGLLQGALGA